MIYIGSFITQQILDTITSKMEKNHEKKCSKTQHFYQYANGCKEGCRDKKPVQTFINT